jgi:hypothetical protein
MGWSLRKGIRLVPLRLNLSKRGFGVSVSVKGLRAGVDASGKPYVAGGRGGLHFREGIRTADATPTDTGRRRGGSATLAWTVAMVLVVSVLLLLFAR